MTTTHDPTGAPVVDLWLQRVTAFPPEGGLASAFEGVFNALWSRANQTLGNVTLVAIADRVLYVAAEQFPVFSAIELEASGLRWEAFRARVGEVSAAELSRGVRFVLIEFLRVLGNLTAEVLTPPLHAVLDRAADEASPSDSTPDLHPAPRAPDTGKDTKP